MGKSLLSDFGLFVVLSISSCGNSSSSTYDDSDTIVDDSIIAEDSILNSPYIDNHLSTGDVPYTCTGLSGDASFIKVKASESSDVVVIIKSDDVIVCDAYICAGSSYKFDVPNGTYQVFFYEGQGWNPEKTMPNGENGGFVAYESFSKDEPVELDNQSLSYELIPREDGNFQTEPSNRNEVF